ncbi:snake venom vascular endothelial growth factor toxin ICPP isoform X2 [Scleropages formosus]|uniref:snake venom vascular endothelial growth factor toxin ICPP isoform X2 n=1 Tax=Scleropages formosus TaxID=113540 RepID=UPI0010FA8258|nr:placenta growth factor isoform X2 [Scleropages formosus]
MSAAREMNFFAYIVHISAVLQLHGLPAQTFLSSRAKNSSFEVMPFQEVWERSFCRTIEKLVEVVQEYPGEVEHIFSPTCVPLVRCAGCCGDENLECYPTHTSNVTMQLLKIKPAEVHQEYVDMAFMEHKACECRPKKVMLKNGRRRGKGRGRKRKEKQKMKGCDQCQPPRR